MTARSTAKAAASLMLVPVLLAASGGGCAGGASGAATARAGNVDDVREALGKGKSPARGPVNGGGKPMAFIATSGPGGAKIVAYDLAGRKVSWTQPAEVTARIVVGRSVILAPNKTGALVARDVGTGEIRWQEAAPGPGMRRIGYAADGDDVFVVNARNSGTARPGDGELVALEGATGKRRWRVELMSALVGGPSARGGIVAVPQRSQFVSLFSAASGDELAQIISREEAASWTVGKPEGLFFGSKGAFLVTPETASGSHKAPGYMQATLPKFVRAIYHWDTYARDQQDYSATDKNRLLWRAAVDGGKATFEDGMVFVHSFRFFFGFDARSGDLRWAYNHPRVEAASSEHTGKAIVFVTTDGEIGALDAGTGRRTMSAHVPGVTVRGATFDADGFAPSETGAEAPALAPTLSSIVWDPDRRFADAKIFAVDELAKQPGREVTGELLKVLDKEGIAAPLYQRAGDALVARKDKAALDLYLASLATHTDFAADRKPRGLDVLIKAVAAMDAKEAVPAMVSHLRQPDTAPLVVQDVAEALVKMNARDALPDLRDFLVQYRADTLFLGDPAPLIAVTEALLKLGGPADRELLLFVAEEGKTLDSLRTHIRRALLQTAK